MATKYKYKYETHLHTSEVSRCARATAAEQVRSYHDRGYTGIIITDHFFNGNTTVPREGLSWEEKVNLFCVGYENALSEGKKSGLDVFFGWEYSLHGCDYLTYGLDKGWLLAHPEIMEMNLGNYCDFVREEGGLIIHAHPFREADYIDMIRLIPRHVDGVEAPNANRTDFENRLAREYARNYDLTVVAGSDNHSASAQTHLAGIKTVKKLETSTDYVSAVKGKDFRIFTEYFDTGETNE